MRFCTFTGLATELLEKLEERQMGRLLGRLERHQLLVLNELRDLPFTKAGAGLLFEVVSRAPLAHC